MASELTPPETATESDIYRLMSMDPLGMTDKDIDKIIAHYRSQRHRFNARPAGKAKEPKAIAGPGKSMTKLIQDLPELDL